MVRIVGKATEKRRRDVVKALIEEMQREEYYYYNTLTEEEVEALTKIYVAGMDKKVVRLEINDSDFGFEHRQDEFFEDYTKFPIVITLYKEINNMLDIKQVIDL